MVFTGILWIARATPPATESKNEVDEEWRGTLWGGPLRPTTCQLEISILYTMEISNDMSYPTGSPHGLSLKRFMSLRLRVPGEQALGVNRPQEPRVLGHEAVSGRGGSPVGIFLIKSLGIARHRVPQDYSLRFPPRKSLVTT